MGAKYTEIAEGAYYVTDIKSNCHGTLVFRHDGKWKDHLGRDIRGHFNGGQLRQSDIKVPEIKPCGRDLEQIIEDAECPGFFHFTDITNLPTISGNGYIASRSRAENEALSAVDSEGHISFGNHHVAGGMCVRDFARFTMQADSPIIYHWQGIIQGQCVPQPCMLRVDPLIATIEGVYFSKTNANTRNQQYGDDHRFLAQIPLAQLNRGRGLDVRTRGAEVLYPDAAPINFLEEIAFRSIGEMKYAKHLTEGWELQPLMRLNPALLGNGKCPTYLMDAYIGSSRNAMEHGHATDIKSSSIRPPALFFCYALRNFREEQRVSVEVWHEGSFKGKTKMLHDNHCTVDIKNIVSERGRYEVRLLLHDSGRDFIIYSVRFKAE
jgi:hypothetical protein